MRDVTFKRIVYAYGGSVTANKLQMGNEFEKSGCFCIEYEKHRNDVSGRGERSIDRVVGGFKDICPELKEAFLEADGFPCPLSTMINSKFYE